MRSHVQVVPANLSSPWLPAELMCSEYPFSGNSAERQRIAAQYRGIQQLLVRSCKFSRKGYPRRQVQDHMLLVQGRTPSKGDVKPPWP
jgi:hypothetical protein